MADQGKKDPSLSLSNHYSNGTEGVHQKIHCLYKTIGFPHPKASNELKDEFVEYSKKVAPIISIKHDGINIFIDSNGGKVLKKIDECKKDVMKVRDTSILPRSEWIYVELAIYWIDVIKANDPVDVFIWSAMKKIDGIYHLKFLDITPEGPKLNWKPLSEFDTSTYELMGPKTGTIVNAYQFINYNRDVVGEGWKVDNYPEHFFIQHGIIPFHLEKSIYSDLEELKNFILNSRIEGIVFKFSFDNFNHYFKLNRGHINSHHVGLPLNFLFGINCTTQTLTDFCTI